MSGALPMGWTVPALVAALGLSGCQQRPSRNRSGQAQARGPDRRSATKARPAARRAPPIRVRPRRKPAASPVVRDLPVRGFAPAAYVRPSGPSAKPRPVLVLLHGSHDRRASECQTWARVGRRYGWLLCPAGLHRQDYPQNVDRWTWGKVIHAVKEIRRALAALQKRYPGQVIDRNLTLIGFSLGALIAHEVAYFGRGLFRELVVVEGLAHMKWKWARRIKRRGIRRIAVVGGQKSFWPAMARRRTWYLRRVGIRVRHFEIPDVSHEYGDRFDPEAEQILAWIRRPYATETGMHSGR